MDFENQFLRVLCITDPETVRGLQWALDRQALSGRRYQLFTATLAQLAQSSAARAGQADVDWEADIVLLTLDLGQPVPVENLKRLAGRPGVCALVQPTPQQLLSLGELHAWSAVAWDGVNFDRLVERIDLCAQRFEEELRVSDFARACRSWVQRNRQLPGAVEWMNPPENWTGARHLPLDTHRAFLTVGALNSRADMRLSVPGDSELGEFRFAGGAWHFKAAVPSSSSASSSASLPRVEIKSAGPELRPGDHVEVDSLHLQVRMSDKVEEFIALGRRMDFDLGHGANLVNEGEQRTLADVCKEMLYGGATGELRLSAGLKSGSIFFWDGTIHYAVTGAVSGVKAVLRMLGWEAPQWRFASDRKTDRSQSTLRITLREFTQIHQRWRSMWNRVHALTPPAQVQLRVVPNTFLSKHDWSDHEAQVLASICEYRSVRDVLNNCPLSDVEIVDTLVAMRRQKLIEPLRPER